MSLFSRVLGNTNSSCFFHYFTLCIIWKTVNSGEMVSTFSVLQLIHCMGLERTSWLLIGTEDKQYPGSQGPGQMSSEGPQGACKTISSEGDSGTKSTGAEASKGVDSNPRTGANLEIFTGNETLTSAKMNRWPPSEDTAPLSLKTGPQTVWKGGASPTLALGEGSHWRWEWRRENVRMNDGLQKWIAGETTLSLV